MFLILQFGKGIYFADMSSKSANYCFTTRSKNIGLVLLSEVCMPERNTFNVHFKSTFTETCYIKWKSEWSGFPLVAVKH